MRSKSRLRYAFARTFAFAAGAFALLASCAFAAVLDVPSEYETLEAALAAAQAGDTIRLAPGDYELLDYAGLVLSNGVEVVGSDDPSQTVIHAKPAGGGYAGSRLGLALTNATLSGVTLTGCHAASSTSGQILALRGGSLVTNCVVENSTVDMADVGSAVSLSGTSRMTRSTIRNVVEAYQNPWTGKCGDFVLLLDAAELADSVVSNNTIHVFGSAAVGVKGASASLRRTLVAGNLQKAAEYMLGAAGVYAEAGVVEDCEIRGNALESGFLPSFSANGLYATGSAAVRRCLVAGNTGWANRAGGVYAAQGAVLENIVVLDNETPNANACGGVCLEGGAVLVHATIYGNRAMVRTEGHGLRLAGANSKVYNTIVYGNGFGAARFTGGNFEKTAGSISHSLVPGADEAALGGEGMLSGNPLFKDAAAGDFSLRLVSPCRDAGADLATTAYGACVTNDFALVPRPQLEGPDLGAYEYATDGTKVADAVADEDPTAAGRLVTFTATALPADGIASYAWTFTAADGSTASETTAGPTAGHAFGVSGLATAEVTVAWSAGGTATARVPCRVAGRVAYADPAGAGVWPYDTAAKAAANVQDAIDAVYAEADAPGRVYLAPGTYGAASGQGAEEAHLFSIGRPVVLAGLGARPEDTVLDGEEARRILHLAHARAVVTNVLLRNAKNMGSEMRIGFSIQNDGGTVADCIVSNRLTTGGQGECSVCMTAGVLDGLVVCEHGQGAAQVGGNWVPVYLAGGVMRRSAVSRNRFRERSTGGAVTLVGDAVMEDCRVVGNEGAGGEYSDCAAGGVYLGGGATLRRSLVANNTYRIDAHRFVAGGLFVGQNSASLVEACTITNNLAAGAGSGHNFLSTGGVYLRGPATLRNCLVAGNRCESDSPQKTAGGVRMDANGALLNSTVCGNASPAVPTNGAVRMTAGSITNCIVWGNGSMAAGAWVAADIQREGGEVGYTCCETAVDGQGNFAADPRFVAPGAGDYRLRLHSPCFRAGTRLDGLAYDLRGLPRSQSREPDLGCFTLDFALPTFLLVR